MREGVRVDEHVDNWTAFFGKNIRNRLKKAEPSGTIIANHICVPNTKEYPLNTIISKLTTRLFAMIPFATIALTVFHPPVLAAPGAKSPKKPAAEQQNIRKNLLKSFGIPKLKEFKNPEDKKTFSKLFRTIVQAPKGSADALPTKIEEARSLLEAIQSKISVNASPAKMAFRLLEAPELASAISKLIDTGDAKKVGLAEQIIKLSEVDSVEVSSNRLLSPKEIKERTEEEIDLLTEFTEQDASQICSKIFYALSKTPDADTKNIDGYSNLLKKILDAPGDTVADKIKNVKDEIELFKKILKCK